jgi:hypothetical protein
MKSKIGMEQKGWVAQNRILEFKKFKLKYQE